MEDCEVVWIQTHSLTVIFGANISRIAGSRCIQKYVRERQESHGCDFSRGAEKLPGWREEKDFRDRQEKYEENLKCVSAN